jgi:hypothetical protein
MFNFIIKKKIETPAEEKLEEIKNILFPPLKSFVDKERNKFHIDYSADTNLTSVLLDLEEGFNDETAQKTIKGVIDQLDKVRKILEFYQKLDSDAKYVVSDDYENLEKELDRQKDY